MSWLPPTLHTPRLVLRPLQLEDAPAIYRYASKAEVARYTLWQPHGTVADSESFIRDYAFSRYAEQEAEPLGIALKSKPDTVIGTCGAWWVSVPSQVMELAYALSDEHWNQGITTEAVRALLQHLFATTTVNRVQAHFKKENAASGKVMEKSGMKFEGTQRDRVFHNQRFWDTVHYAVLRSEWKA